MHVAMPIAISDSPCTGMRVAHGDIVKTEDAENGFVALASRNISVGARRPRHLLSIPGRLREYLGASMIYLTAVVAAFTFGYLLIAMIRPEWF